MTVSATQMPICLSNSKERVRGHVVTIQNSACFQGSTQQLLCPCAAGKKKSCQILVDWALDVLVSSQPRLSSVTFQSNWFPWILRGVSEYVNEPGRGSSNLVLLLWGMLVESSNCHQTLLLLNKDKKVNYYLISAVYFTEFFFKSGITFKK